MLQGMRCSVRAGAVHREGAHSCPDSNEKGSAVQVWSMADRLTVCGLQTLWRQCSGWSVPPLQSSSLSLVCTASVAITAPVQTADGETSLRQVGKQKGSIHWAQSGQYYGIKGHEWPFLIVFNDEDITEEETGAQNDVFYRKAVNGWPPQ